MNATDLLHCIAHHPVLDHSSNSGTLPNHAHSMALVPTDHYTALEKIIVHLEEGNRALAFHGWLPAVNAILLLLQPGQEIIANQDINTHIQEWLNELCPGYGINIQYVDTLHPENIEAAITPATKMIWLETPSFTTLQIADLYNISKIGEQHQCLLCVDNTLASPVLLKPLSLGADLVLHTHAANLSGHHHSQAGFIVTKNKALGQQLLQIREQSSTIPTQLDAAPIIRGIQTIFLRMRHQSTTALRIAGMLKDHPIVDKVYYPGLITHPNHFIAARHLAHFTNTLSFSLKINNQAAAQYVLENIKRFTTTSPDTACRSTISHPASGSHQDLSSRARKAMGIQESLLRVTAGLEDAYDLIRDLEQALNTLQTLFKTKNQNKCLSQKAWSSASSDLAS